MNAVLDIPRTPGYGSWSWNSAALSMPSFERVIESCACPILIISRAAQTQPIVYASPAFLELAGYSLDDLSGRAWSCLFERDGPESSLETFSDAIRSGSRYQGTLHAKHRSGAKSYVDIRLAPLSNEAGLVTHSVAVLNDITAERRRRDILEYRAYHDQLTGLGNRHLLQDRFELVRAQVGRGAPAFSLVLLDLNGFKPINDRFGHEAGDALLRLVGARLKSVVRDGDTVARLGGDEFVLLMPETHSVEAAQALVARVRESLLQPIRLPGATVHVSCCAGVALYLQDGVELDELLREADVRLYRAKSARGTYSCGAGQPTHYECPVRTSPYGSDLQVAAISPSPLHQHGGRIHGAPLWRASPNVD